MPLDEVYLRPVRGMRDLLPEDYYQIINISNKLSKVAESYGYLRVETPALEHFEVLKAKAGEEIINEIYYLRDKAGREVGLRFDLTVPIARIVSYRKDLPRPIRWYYISKVWRYDEPQHGRYREFHQYGIELIGWSSIQADAESIEVLIKSLDEVSLEKFEVRLNDRRIVENILDNLNIPKDYTRLKILRILDKRGKVSNEELIKMLQDVDVGRDVAEMLVNIANTVIPIDKSLEVLHEFKIDSSLIDNISKLIEELDVRGIIKKVFLDFGIVRGLDYYTGIVYEVYVPEYSLAIGGGGRYDDLIEIYSGVKVPALGFAIGIERLVEVLQLQGKLDKPKLGPDYYVYTVGSDRELRDVAYRIANSLRSKGFKVILEFGERSLRTVLEYASKIGSKKFIIVGKREFSKGVVKIRDLERWVEEEVEIEKLIRGQYI